MAFGIFAVVLARGWINDAIRDEYSRRTKAAPRVTAKAIDTVPVVILDADVSFGDVLTPELLKVVEYPEGSIPLGTYENINNIFVDPGQATVVLRHMSRHEPVLDYKISGPGARGSLSALITEGMRAVSVQVNAVNGVSGFIMPGDYVDVIYTRDEETRRNGNNLKSDILLQNVKVLGIGQDLNDQRAEPNVVKTVTLEVANVDAQKLHLARDAGQLSLTLRRAGDVEVQTAQTVEQKTLLNTKQKRAVVRPYRRSVSKKKPATSNMANVTVIRGETSAQVQVLKDDIAKASSDRLAGG